MNCRLTFGLLLLLSCLTGLPSFAGPAKTDFASAVEELIAHVEKHDPHTQTATEEWTILQKHLRAAAAIAETEQGFAKSLEEIWTGWNGLGLRLLTDSQLSYYAYKADAQSFWEAGVVFAQRGARWYVKQLTPLAPAALHRGDSVMLDGFHPVRSLARSEVSLRIQSQALAKPHTVVLKSRPTSLVDWALAATQAASSRVAWEGKKLCFEKAWLWLSRESEAALLSKIKFAQQNCDALLVDLRDTSGPGGSDRLTLPPFKIPVAVLVNRETREGAVSLAMELKKVAQSEILGEPTASRQSPQQVLSLKNLTSLVLLYPQNSGSLLPDQMVDDRWMYTEGFDGVKERAIQYLQGKLRRS